MANPGFEDEEPVTQVREHAQSSSARVQENLHAQVPEMVVSLPAVGVKRPLQAEKCSTPAGLALNPALTVLGDLGESFTPLMSRMRPRVPDSL